MSKSIMTEKQLENRIRSFMARKVREYPELADRTTNTDFHHTKSKSATTLEQIIFRTY